MHRPPLNYAGAAEYLGTSVRHVRELKRRGEIPFAMVGGLVRFVPDQLDEYLAARTVAPLAS